jgi:hypothetical protein
VGSGSESEEAQALTTDTRRVSRGPSKRKGDTVAGAQRRTADDAVRPSRSRQGRAVAKLTRAEARALERSAPLTPAQFKELRRLAEQGVSPLRHI